MGAITFFDCPNSGGTVPVRNPQLCQQCPASPKAVPCAFNGVGGVDLETGFLCVALALLELGL
ncbi:rCG21659 [Rattus norvegicus]|uniref:RCG21659 n=1 Tax=Rattus norvegicus TaxID=10116 RepID=A6J1K7_RAT|nr:rCG21659 [Rattus norvegicus]